MTLLDRLALLLRELLDFVGVAFWRIVLTLSALVWIVAIWGLGYLAVLSAGAAP